MLVDRQQFVDSLGGYRVHWTSGDVSTLAEASFRVNHFEIVVLDDDRSLFAIVGPMKNDTDLKRRLEACRAKGRHLTCYGAVSNSMSKAQFVEATALATGCRHVLDVLKSSHGNQGRS